MVDLQRIDKNWYPGIQCIYVGYTLIQAMQPLKLISIIKHYSIAPLCKTSQVSAYTKTRAVQRSWETKIT